MIRRNRYIFIVLAFLGVSVCGCTDAPEKAAKAELGLKPIKVTREIESFQGVVLPELDVVQRTLDAGRLKVRGPKNWQRLRREQNRLIGFFLTKASPFPSIQLRVGNIDWSEPVSEENVYEFARHIRTELKQRMNRPKKSIIGDMRPVAIGETYFGVLYVLRGKDKFGPLKRLFLVTAAGGRRYTIELQAIEGTLQNFRPHALAVASGLEFHDAVPPEENDENIGS